MKIELFIIFTSDIYASLHIQERLSVSHSYLVVLFFSPFQSSQNAAKRGDLAELQRLLARGAPVNHVR